jgi:hypothetical protein
MSAALVRRWFEEVWNQRKVETIDALMGADVVAHGLPPEAPRGPAGFRQFHASFLSLFSELRITVEETIEGPPARDGAVAVAARFTAHVRLRENGRRGELPCMCTSRWRDGKIIEAWNVCDFHALAKQVGPLPL